MDNRWVKPSFYNMLIEKKEGIAVYNTRTGKLVRNFGKDADIIRKYLESEKSYLTSDDAYMREMYEYGLLVNWDFDEIREMDEKEKDSEYGNYMQLILLPTEQCNFRCVYCYEHFERGKMSEKTQESILQYVEGEIDKFSGLNVIWFGGEPTEAMDVMENLSNYLIEICRRKKKPYTSGITTNGYNLTLDFFKKLKKMRITDYQVTIDGLPEIHDKQRVLANGEKTFDVIMNNLVEIKKNIHSATITFVLRTNISKKMLGHMDEFCALLDKYFKNDKRFKFFWQLVGDYGYVKEESVRDLFGEIKDYKWLIENYTDWFINSFSASLYGPDGGVCYAFKRNSVVIDANGNIRKCTCDLDTKENWFGIIGQALDKEKHEAWLNERAITPESLCYRCKKRPLCHNRQCHKAKTCSINFMFLDQILEQMSERSEYYKILGGGN